ncbi:hypothetical protein BABINDRAFT_167871 [Babjeviella inositovora NRRL Y-12698]|uniref:Uncharacterized protein n=1 Tax=Babjeviella inositovora NRRL Y-12698 TaxID=984486 RepID=A0A1E3QMI1_9ASCO|nr:uncharacterized protein BABINDRAFT_167871 [Babjeviella inositovora NRRL Y-12698]ODQ78674.1 hypothetical protein BABINDRAFT_167871 [Babjeviella inositovora NRRL Y-12698]
MVGTPTGMVQGFQNTTLESIASGSVPLSNADDPLFTSQTMYLKEDQNCDFLGANNIPFTGHRVFKSSSLKNDVILTHSLVFVNCFLGSAIQTSSIKIDRKDDMIYNRMFNAIKNPRNATFPNGTLLLELYHGMDKIDHRSKKWLMGLKNVFVDLLDSARIKWLSSDWYFNHKNTVSRHYNFALRSLNNKTLAAEIYYSPENMDYYSFARYAKFRNRKITAYIPFQTVGGQFSCVPTKTQLDELIAKFEYSKIGGAFDGDFVCDPETAVAVKPLLADEFYKFRMGAAYPNNPFEGSSGIQFQTYFHTPLVFTASPLDPRYMFGDWSKGLRVDEGYAYTSGQWLNIRELENKLILVIGDVYELFLLPNSFFPFEADFWKGIFGDVPLNIGAIAVDSVTKFVVPKGVKQVMDSWFENGAWAWTMFPLHYDLDTFLTLLIRKLPYDMADYYKSQIEKAYVEFDQSWRD